MEDGCERADLVKKAMGNCTDSDYLMWLGDNKIDPLTYFDINRMHKLRDKLKPDVY